MTRKQLPKAIRTNEAPRGTAARAALDAVMAVAMATAAVTDATAMTMTTMAAATIQAQLSLAA